jgi:hypothetical protein
MEGIAGVAVFARANRLMTKHVTNCVDAANVLAGILTLLANACLAGRAIFRDEALRVTVGGLAVKSGLTSTNHAWPDDFTNCVRTATVWVAFAGRGTPRWIKLINKNYNHNFKNILIGTHVGR